MTRSRWVFPIAMILSVTITALLVAGRVRGHHLRNFRVVEDGVLYRSGQLTPTGLVSVLDQYGIETVVTLRPVPDPRQETLTEWESEVCVSRHVKYVRITPGAWAQNRAGEIPADRTLKEFFAVLDDPACHPVLVHCEVGVRRTGAMCAVYRMEYQHWSAERAIEEMATCGYGPEPGRREIEHYLRNYRSRSSSFICVNGN